ncbi:MAG: DUF3226 domain-containing protein [Phycisphaerae bacterium]
MDLIRLEHPLILLCEGAADQNFFKEMIEKRAGYPHFNYLNPTEHYGATNFEAMLKAIQGDQKSFSRLKGILILADSATDPQKTFKNICDQVRRAGAFPVPTAPGQTALPDPNVNKGMPAVCIMLLPTDTQPGALETLCVKVLLKQYPWAQDCLNSYLKCDKIDAHNWPAEKLDKARYHCLVAAIHRDDPSKAVSNAFRAMGGGSKPPLIDVTDPIFDETALRINEFCGALQGP